MTNGIARQRFLKFYSRFAGFINILMLPHHGSIHNHCDEVLHAMPELRVGFAAAGPNNYGHPHDAVRYAIQTHHDAYFHDVDLKQFNQIVVTVRER